MNPTPQIVARIAVSKGRNMPWNVRNASNKIRPTNRMAIGKKIATRSENVSIRDKNDGSPLMFTSTESSRILSAIGVMVSIMPLKPVGPLSISITMAADLKSVETMELIYAGLRRTAAFSSAICSGVCGTLAMSGRTSMPSAVPRMSFALFAASDKRFSLTTPGLSRISRVKS